MLTIQPLIDDTRLVAAGRMRGWSALGMQYASNAGTRPGSKRPVRPVSLVSMLSATSSCGRSTGSGRRRSEFTS